MTLAIKVKLLCTGRLGRPRRDNEMMFVTEEWHVTHLGIDQINGGEGWQERWILGNKRLIRFAMAHSFGWCPSMLDQDDTAVRPVCVSFWKVSASRYVNQHVEQLRALKNKYLGHSPRTEWIWFQNSWHQYMSNSTFRSTDLDPFPLRMGSTSIATFSAQSLRKTFPMLASRNAFPYHVIHSSIVLVNVVFPRNKVWGAIQGLWERKDWKNEQTYTKWICQLLLMHIAVSVQWQRWWPQRWKLAATIWSSVSGGFPGQPSNPESF